MRHVHGRRPHRQTGLGCTARLPSDLRVERLLREIVHGRRLPPSPRPVVGPTAAASAAAGLVRVAVVLVRVERGQRGGRAARARARVLVRVEDAVHVLLVAERRRAPSGRRGVVLALREAQLLVVAVCWVDARLLEADRVRVRVCVLGEHPALVLLVPEEPLAEPREAVPPVAAGVDTLRCREVRGGRGAALAGATAPAHEDDDKDEGAAEGHQEDLPPCERAADGRGGGGRWGVDAGDGREGRGGTRRRGDDDQVREADTETGNGAGSPTAVCRRASTASEDLARA